MLCFFHLRFVKKISKILPEYHINTSQYWGILYNIRSNLIYSIFSNNCFLGNWLVSTSILESAGKAPYCQQRKATPSESQQSLVYVFKVSLGCDYPRGHRIPVPSSLDIFPHFLKTFSTQFVPFTQTDPVLLREMDGHQWHGLTIVWVIPYRQECVGIAGSIGCIVGFLRVRCLAWFCLPFTRYWDLISSHNISIHLYAGLPHVDPDNLINVACCKKLLLLILHVSVHQFQEWMHRIHVFSLTLFTVDVAHVKSFSHSPQ